MNLPTVIATSVIRGSAQGQSHGGTFLIDLETGNTDQVLDWDSCEIDFAGRGADRGLRGIAIIGEDIYIAASDELFLFDRQFNIRQSFRSPYLKHCHEICTDGRSIFLTSTGFNSILGFDTHRQSFNWGLALAGSDAALRATTFDPAGKGPTPRGDLHLNSVYNNDRGLFIGGVNCTTLFHFDGRNLKSVGRLPRGTHNLQPFNDGVLFNDTAADKVRFVTDKSALTFDVPRYCEDKIINRFDDTTNLARQAFGRGLCPINRHLIAAGSSPSTISVHDIQSGNTLKTVNFSMDIRNSVHGLEVWPF